ncbi:MAG: fumarate hydratase, class II [Flavobacteriaceae bacterium]|nr:fumarate hydratase, class II [Flavobacteriaceae bacterium]|tara:strand:+ start:2438 stop:3829 length:1392 start_codon:yes stop_codon:yes gene_type:complete
MKFRTESDTLGKVKIPIDSLWGPQTQRSINNFNIGAKGSMPIEIIHAYAILKKACAKSNFELGVLDKNKMNLIINACQQIIDGKHDKEFPLVIWQTGSGTQTNMNLNEVISNIAHIKEGKKLADNNKTLRSNDDVNKSQSSNDSFPTAMHIAAYKLVVEKAIPSINDFYKSLLNKVKEFENDVKIGRTHLMDATPLTFGQEFSGYASQVKHGLKSLENSLDHLSELAIGGTAVGTGLNAPNGFDKITVKNISDDCNIKFKVAENKFEALAAHDAIIETHSALKQIAISIYKIANDIRLLGSGPRAGFSELILPSNEPGSSIMPGKINPTQCESICMVCAQVIGNDYTISFAGTQGQLELNVYKPLMASKIIESLKLLSDAIISFNKNCIIGLKVNKKKITEHLNNSLMLVTALNNKIGYYKAAEIANNAYKNGTTLKEEALKLKYLSEDEFDKWVDPKKMTGK